MNALVAPGPLTVTLDPEKTALLARRAGGLAPEQLYWVAAWGAARAGQAQRRTEQAAAPASPRNRRDWPFYGSQAGNARRLAEQVAARSEADGLPVRLLHADAHVQRELARGNPSADRDQHPGRRRAAGPLPQFRRVRDGQARAQGAGPALGGAGMRRHVPGGQVGLKRECGLHNLL